MNNEEMSSPIFPGDRIVNQSRLESWLERNVSVLSEPEIDSVVKSPYEQEETEKALTLESIESLCSQALVENIGSHPQCPQINPATMLALIARVRRAESDAAKVRALLGKGVGISLASEDTCDLYKQGFIDGKNFQIDQNRSAPLPSAWLVVNELTKKVRLYYKKPDHLEGKFTHAQALYTRGDNS